MAQYYTNYENKVLEVREVSEEGDPKTITLDYMRRYGWENVT